MLLALWIRGMTTASSPAQAVSTSFDSHSWLALLNLLAIGFAIAAIHGSLRLRAGIVAFLVLLGAALAVCYFR